ncbi:MAG: hypothetical protein AB8B74_02535 [Crocinitomicaceae bacterium]
MEINYLKAYKDYYRVRAERFANNPNYKFSYEAESNLSDAIQSCNKLIEFKERIGNLNELCAIALIKDEYLIEQAFYKKHKEVVRMMAANRILNKLDEVSDTTELITLVTEEMNKNSLEITIDEAQRTFQGDWTLLDRIEIYENAIVPSVYKSEFLSMADEIKTGIIKGNQNSELEVQKFDSNFVMKPEMNLQYRHRRLMPYSDEHFSEQIVKYKTLVNR